MAGTEAETETTRLHISPFNESLRSLIIPPSLQSSASHLSFHTIQTFPDRDYGYVTLPTAEAEKLRKKLHGYTLRGSKMRIEVAKPDTREKRKKKRSRRHGGDVDSDSDAAAAAEEKRQKRRKTAKPDKIKKEMPGWEMPAGRKVERGWTDPAASNQPPQLLRKDKKKLEKEGKESSETKKKTKRVKTKYTTEPEVLFKTKLEPVAATTVEVEKRKKEKESKEQKKARRSDDRVVVHEFAKNKNFPSFLRAEKRDESRGVAHEFVEGKGWVDVDGNVVEAVQVKPKREDRLKTIVEVEAPVYKRASSDEEEESDSSEEEESESDDESDDEDSADEAPAHDDDPEAKKKQALARIDKMLDEEEEQDDEVEATKEVEGGQSVGSDDEDTDAAEDDEADKEDEKEDEEEEEEEEEEKGDEEVVKTSQTAEDEGASSHADEHDKQPEQATATATKEVPVAEKEQSLSADEDVEASESEAESESESEAESELETEESEAGSEAESQAQAQPDKQDDAMDVDRPATPPKEVHPLEALFKRSKPAQSVDSTPKPAPVKTSFSFFDQPDDDEEDNEPHLNVDVPQTPYGDGETAYRSRGIRSAAPTPDTAAIGKRFFYNDHEEEWDNNNYNYDAADDNTHANTMANATTDNDADQAETDFAKWFWENRGDTNRAWKKRRREVLKVKRQRENRRVTRRVV